MNPVLNRNISPKPEGPAGRRKGRSSVGRRRWWRKGIIHPQCLRGQFHKQLGDLSFLTLIIPKVMAVALAVALALALALAVALAVAVVGVVLAFVTNE